MFKTFILATAVLLEIILVGCASTGPTYEGSRVVERMGAKRETPLWSTGEAALIEDKGEVVFVSTTSMSGDTRTEACMRVAEETGRAQMLRYIRDAITSGGQVSELSASGDPGVESLTAYLSEGKLSGARIAARYWEKREESDSTGTRVLRVHCAAKVGIPKAVLDKQLRQAINGGEGNAAIRAKLLEAQKSFIDNISKSSTSSEETRTPSSSEESNLGDQSTL